MRDDDESDLWRWWEEQHAPDIDDLFQTRGGNGCAASLAVMVIWIVVLLVAVVLF